jgi:hypothetical protein
MQGVFSNKKNYLNATIYSGGYKLYSISTSKGVLGGHNLTTIKDGSGVAGAIHWEGNFVTVGKRDFPLGVKTGFYGRYISCPVTSPAHFN